nr:unnamed protein product [Callosobruchus chinensis]
MWRLSRRREDSTTIFKSNRTSHLFSIVIKLSVLSQNRQDLERLSHFLSPICS